MKRIFTTAVLIAIAVVALGLEQAAWSQSSGMKMLEGMLAADGAVVVVKKGCTSCHSFDGWGGMFGPDLGYNRIRGTSPSALAAAMWNQAPSMWRSIAPDAVPTLDQKEAAGLFAFFYSRLYFDSFGDSSHGEDLFKTRCGSCHDLKAAPNSKKVGPPVVTWGTIIDPIALVGRMWNHSTDMLDQTLRQGKSWPRLSGPDTRDLVYYFSRLPELRGAKSAFRFGDDTNGRHLFNEHCGQCHSLDRREPGRIDLTEKVRAVTMTRLAASMWNHAPSMKRARPGTKLPTLTEDDTRDLVTYLVVGRAFEEKGDPRSGERVFQTKQCASCHEGSLSGPFNPVRMTSALWSHGPNMLAAMKRDKMAWPRFKTDEMRDLLAYLNAQ